jgi:two-component system OmpR family sensor kinase/two-component system sensor histidine kinase BaeS
LQNSPQSTLKSAVQQTRRRLNGLLLQAFGVVVVITTVITLVLMAVIFSQDQETFGPSMVAVLEGYYFTEGGWADPAELPRLFEQVYGGRVPLNWQNFTLLDVEGMVLLDEGRATGERIGQPYTPQSNTFDIPLHLEDEPIGTVIIERSPAVPLVFSTGIVLWIGIFSFFPALLIVIVALLLARRVIMPLAEVIVAAHNVAEGNLAVRVPAQGPADLQDLIESFNHMASSLEKNQRERRDMLADIAHELRNPLAVIRGRMEGVIDGVYPSEEAHLLPVLEEVYILERLVDDLRLLTQAETRQLQLDMRPVDLGGLAEHAILLFEAAALEKHITLTLETPDALPHVEADPQRTAQVISNLMSNALRYVPDHGEVRLSLTPVTGGVELAISDNGPGLPEKDLPFIFERFWRHDRARTRSRGGAGLGLAIARQLIEMQGGTITANPAETGGLRVAFVLQDVEST